MKKLYTISLAFILALTFWGARTASALEERTVSRVMELTISASINPATLNYLKSNIERAHELNFQMVLIKLNTPGGLVTTTKDILTTFGESTVPIVVWVAPEGASATSAGALIAAGAHLLYMGEGTNMGAATPITMSGDLDKGQGKKEESSQAQKKQMSDMKKKAVNDLVALVKSLSIKKGRNGNLFARMITDAESFTAQEARSKRLINGLANSRSEVWKAADGKTVIIQDKRVRLSVESPEVVERDMDVGQQILNIFANPSLAYILFLIGAALLYLEMQAPGGFVAGSIGAVFIVMAGIGFQVLPLNFGSLGLILLAFILFVLEGYVVSYGILTLSGLISLTFGSLFLFRTENSYIEFKTSLVAQAVLAVAIFVGFIAYVLVKDFKKVVAHDLDDNQKMLGKKAEVLEQIHEGEGEGAYLYIVKVQGERWKAKSTRPLKVGDFADVEGMEGSLLLKIK